jgi:putative FmdB family regulatory protein
VVKTEIGYNKWWCNMPTYEYECDFCDFLFEKFHSISAKPLRRCPQCKKNTLVRLISGGGAVIVRGTNTPCRGGRKLEEIQEQKHERKNKIKKQKQRAKEMMKKNPPWWRPNRDEVNMDVLKNPKKYIETGEV